MTKADLPDLPEPSELPDLSDLPELPLAQKLALPYSSKADRPVMHVFFALDARLGQIVLEAKEPMLAQLRLAWWREQLNLSAQDRPKGEPLLALISAHWQGEEAALAALVDGWETALEDGDAKLSGLEQLVAARSLGFAAIARLLGLPDHAEAAKAHGQYWAAGDLRWLTQSPDPEPQESQEQQEPQADQPSDTSQDWAAMTADKDQLGDGSEEGQRAP